MSAQLQLQAMPEAAPPPGIGVKPTRLAVWVEYTGLVPSRTVRSTLYDPPLDRLLIAVLAEVERHPSTVELVAARKDREPPVLHDSIVLLTRDRDAQGNPRRWPVAYLTPVIGELPFADLAEAFVRIGGQRAGAR